ncbi:MAG TPA: hypothetical protein VG722_12615 [Tepidisphaeraceae bacterium]|nr:hypothetical protein [Tepidisphaeraceae bacterium]
MADNEETTPATGKPRTPVVLLLLLIASVVLSYLWAYAVSDALVAGHLMQASSDSADSRPAQMRQAFFVIAGTFLVIGVLVRWISARQLRRIDAMNDD